MNPIERKRILEMLAQGKITAAEADELLQALSGAAQESSAGSGILPNAAPKYLRVVVEGEEDGSPQKVNIRVPMQLIRAGIRLTAFVPAGVQDKVDEALAENGIPARLKDLKPENLEEILATLADLSVDVDQKNQKVRVFCE